MNIFIFGGTGDLAGRKLLPAFWWRKFNWLIQLETRSTARKQSAWAEKRGKNPNGKETKGDLAAVSKSLDRK